LIDEVSAGDTGQAERRIKIIEIFPQLEITDDVTRLAEALLKSFNRCGKSNQMPLYGIPYNGTLLLFPKGFLRNSGNRERREA